MLTEREHEAERAQDRLIADFARGDPSWIERLGDDQPKDVLRLLFTARGNPAATEAAWKHASHLAADGAYWAVLRGED